MKLLDEFLDPLRKHYRYVPFEDGIAITCFRGFSGRAFIPSTIDGRQVIAVLATTFEEPGIGGFRGGGRYDSMTEIHIPDTVRFLEDNVFRLSYHLVNIRLGNGIKGICSHMFAGCDSLRTIDIPDGVTSIGQSAFSGCTALDLVQGCHHKGDDPKHYSDLGTNVTSIGESAFQDCSSLGRSFNFKGWYFRLPGRVASIGASAFKGCSRLENVALGISTIDIGANAFENCTKLNYIYIPKSVNRIGAYAFAGCKDLEDVYFGGDAPKLGNLVFTGCDKAVVYYEPDKKGWASTFGGRPTRRSDEDEADTPGAPQAGEEQSG